MFKLGIQIFIENIFNSLLTLIRILLLSRRRGVIKKIRTKQSCAILGNGPSLNKSIENHSKFLSNKKLVCVNGFPKFDLYDKLKPGIFVGTAPEYYRDNVDSKYTENALKIFRAIANKTDWSLDMFLPVEARKYKAWQNIVMQNPNVNIRYFNNTPIEGFRGFMHFFFNSGLGMPRPHNVIIPSIMVSLGFGFNEIYLLGADHSWLPEISVDNSNTVLINQKHFFDQGKTSGQPMHKAGSGKRRLHEVLMKFVYTFEGYFTIKDYAQSLGAKIYNCTPGSYIDAFDRIDLDEKENK